MDRCTVSRLGSGKRGDTRITPARPPRRSAAFRSVFPPGRRSDELLTSRILIPSRYFFGISGHSGYPPEKKFDSEFHWSVFI
jgi:hypothetical protein